MNFNFFYFFAFLLISFIFFQIYLRFSLEKKINDKNDFNVGHGNPPTGSGIIFLIIFYLGSIVYFFFDLNFVEQLPNRFYVFYFAIFIFGLVSFYDDIKPLDPILRLVIQFILIFISTVCIDFTKVELPLKLAMMISIFLWIYFINITNFIDGLDGFLATHCIFIIGNIFLIKFYLDINLFSYYLSIILLPAICSFLYFNKPIAKIYMGDSGSIVLGYVFGFIFLELLVREFYLLAVSIFIYPLTDCTITLIKKVLKGHYPWARLFDYFFLAPVLLGKKKHSVVLSISIFFSILNSILIFMQLSVSKYFFILNIIIASLQLFTYRNLSRKV